MHGSLRSMQFPVMQQQSQVHRQRKNSRRSAERQRNDRKRKTSRDDYRVFSRSNIAERILIYFTCSHTPAAISMPISAPTTLERRRRDERATVEIRRMINILILFSRRQQILSK